MHKGRYAFKIWSIQTTAWEPDAADGKQVSQVILRRAPLPSRGCSEGRESCMHHRLSLCVKVFINWIEGSTISMC